MFLYLEISTRLNLCNFKEFTFEQFFFEFLSWGSSYLDKLFIRFLTHCIPIWNSWDFFVCFLCFFMQMHLVGEHKVCVSLSSDQLLKSCKGIVPRGQVWSHATKSSSSIGRHNWFEHFLRSQPLFSFSLGIFDDFHQKNLVKTYVK